MILCMRGSHEMKTGIVDVASFIILWCACEEQRILL